MAEKKTEKKAAKYDEETKVQAVKLAREIGIKKAAEQLNIPYGTLDGWNRKSKTGGVDLGVGEYSAGECLSLAAQLKESNERVKSLEKELHRVQKENEFLEEAAAFFAASRQRSAKMKD